MQHSSSASPSVADSSHVGHAEGGAEVVPIGQDVAEAIVAGVLSITHKYVQKVGDVKLRLILCRKNTLQKC